MEFLEGVLKWMLRIILGIVLGLLALVLVVTVLLLPFAIFIVPGVLVYNSTNSIGWGVVVSAAIFFVESILGTAVIIELTGKTVRFIMKMTKLLWRMVEEFFQ